MSANGLRPYPAYNDPGVEWLGKVPEHWEVRAIKTLFREKDDRSRGGTETLLSFTRQHGILPHSDVAKRPVAATDLSRYRLCETGDLVMNRMQAWSGMLAVTPSPGLVSPDYSVFAPRVASEVHVDFFGHLFRTPLLVDQFARRSRGIGSGFNRLYTPDFGAVPAVFPPLPEQRAIVRFLDAADRRIRRYIRAKERLIKLLEERKRTLVHEAVTGRIDVRTGQPYPAYKDSGVEWLGKVPEHWEVRALGTFGRFFKGSGGTKADETSRGMPCIRYGDLYTRHQFHITESRACVAPHRAGAYTPVRYGDVLFAGSGETLEEIGKSAVNLIRGSAVCGGDVIVFRPTIDVDAEFIGWSTDCREAASQKARMGRGITVMHIYSNSLKYLAVPLPPLPEQRSIALFVGDADRRIRRHISATRRQIVLVEEYRTRLIADVVTGKLDVREAAADLPGTDPLAGNRDRAEATPTESNPQPAEHDMAKEASA